MVSLGSKCLLKKIKSEISTISERSEKYTFSHSRNVSQFFISKNSCIFSFQKLSLSTVVNSIVDNYFKFTGDVIDVAVVDSVTNSLYRDEMVIAEGRFRPDQLKMTEEIKRRIKVNLCMHR